ncbi:hypothetical protein E2C01_095545 [Portunus trituberculatus]|uniref:Uncharacterized protein n=1 Tax=Portunus trituberculatus TaxID=210409 RepID=A0A5B7K613_PORTR|nr:hypothetical protein [Portunus trituberculatus]
MYSRGCEARLRSASCTCFQRGSQSGNNAPSRRPARELRGVVGGAGEAVIGPLPTPPPDQGTDEEQPRHIVRIMTGSHYAQPPAPSNHNPEQVTPTYTQTMARIQTHALGDPSDPKAHTDPHSHSFGSTVLCGLVRFQQNHSEWGGMC